MVDIDTALAGYDAAREAADVRHTRAVEAAERRHTRAVEAARVAAERAETVLGTALGVAGEQLQQDRVAALAALDEALKAAAGVPDEAYVHARGDGVTEVRVDDYGPAVAAMGQAGGGWFVDGPSGREFVGGFAAARLAMWRAAVPERASRR